MKTLDDHAAVNTDASISRHSLERNRDYWQRTAQWTAEQNKRIRDENEELSARLAAIQAECSYWADMAMRADGAARHWRSFAEPKVG